MENWAITFILTQVPVKLSVATLTISPGGCMQSTRYSYSSRGHNIREKFISKPQSDEEPLSSEQDTEYCMSM